MCLSLVLHIPLSENSNKNRFEQDRELRCQQYSVLYKEDAKPLRNGHNRDGSSIFAVFVIDQIVLESLRSIKYLVSTRSL